MGNGGPDKTHLKALESWCQRARELLALRLKAPEVEMPLGEAQPQPVVPTLFAEGAGLMEKARELAKKGAPAGAGPGQLQRFQTAAEVFLKPSVPSKLTPEQKEARFKDTILEAMEKLGAELAAVWREIAREVKQRQRLQAELSLLPSLVASAPAGEQQQLDALHVQAGQAIADAETPDALGKAETAIQTFVKARDDLADRVAQRAQHIESLRQLGAQVPTAPPELPLALDTTGKALAALLNAPELSPPFVLRVETALQELRAARAAAQTEAMALREVRTLYRGESQALRRQLVDLELDKIQGLPKDLRNKAAQIDTLIGAAERMLETARPRSETAQFPAKLLEAKQTFESLVSQAVMGSNVTAKTRVLDQLATRLNALENRAALLPGRDDPMQSFKIELVAAVGKVRSSLRGSATQRNGAANLLADLERDVDLRRDEAGLDQQLYHQRWLGAAATPDPGAIANCLPTFELELNRLRRNLAAAAPLALTLPEVEAQERDAQAFPLLWKTASDDAAAKAQVDTVWLRIQALKPDDLIGAARAPVKVEVQKALLEATAGHASSDAKRDMPGALKLCLALEQRLLAVKGEPVYDANGAALQAIAAPQRQAAFDLCGPALLGTLGDSQKNALGIALAAHGPAIQGLVKEGFGGNPRVLTQALSHCGAEGLAELARAFEGDTKAASRVSLQGLIDQGGLGDRPEILARLLGTGPQDQQAKRGAGLQSLADNFSGEPGQQAMKTLLGDCGLDTQPDLLPALMHEHGLAGDGAALRQFADAFIGNAAEGARGDLKRLVSSGGMADHPKAFAPLVRRGKADVVKKVGAAFTDPADCARLKGLLDDGGLSGRAGEPNRAHQHPDTLAQLVQDGLDGSGENLKTYARAFDGAGGRTKSKEMLAAFNEYPNAQAQAREPGKAIGRLLKGPNLQGTPAQRIDLLSSQFVPQLQAIANTTQRKQAFRMAPHLATKPAAKVPATPAMNAQNIGEVTASVAKRHNPESFSLQYAKDKNYGVQSMFPPGVDVAQLADQALAQMLAGQNFGATVNSVDQDRVTVLCPPGGTPITVEYGTVFDANTGKDLINHFGPRNDPPPDGAALTNGPPHPLETPLFTYAEMEAMFKALGRPVPV